VNKQYYETVATMGKHNKDKESKTSSSIDDQIDTRKLVTSASRNNSHDHASATASTSREGSKKHSSSHSHHSKERDREKDKGRDKERDRDRDRDRNGDGHYDEEQGHPEDEYPSTPSKSVHRFHDRISICMRFVHNQVRAKMILSAALMMLVIYEVLLSGTYSAAGILEAMNRDRDRAMIQSAASQFLNIVGNGQISADADIKIDMGNTKQMQKERERESARETEEAAQKIFMQEEQSEMQIPDSMRNPGFALPANASAAVNSSPPAIQSNTNLNPGDAVSANLSPNPNVNPNTNQPVLGTSGATDANPPILANGISQSQALPGIADISQGEHVNVNMPPGTNVLGQGQDANGAIPPMIGTQNIPLSPQTPSEPQAPQAPQAPQGGIQQVPPPALYQDSLGSGLQNAAPAPAPPLPPVLAPAQGVVAPQTVPLTPITENVNNMPPQGYQIMPPPVLQLPTSNTVASQLGTQAIQQQQPPIAVNSNPSNMIHMNPTQDSTTSMGSVAVPPVVAPAAQDTGSGDAPDSNEISGDTASSSSSNSKTKKGSFMEWFIDSTTEETEGSNETCAGVEDRLRLLLCKSMSKFMRKYKIRRIIDGNCEFTHNFVPVMIANFARDYWGFKYICISQDKSVFDKIRAAGLLKESESVLFLEGMWWKPVDLKDNVGIDMYFMYDVLAHASYGRVWSFFSAGKQSGIKYFVFDNYPAISNDPSPDRKFINVRRYPFKFDRAKDTVNNVTEAGENPEQIVRQLVLYTVDQLPDRL